MRLVRLGREPSAVGADVRAALSTWGHGSEIVGGAALVGVRPDGCPQPIDAVVVLPRGILVVVGVDLPDPAVRLEAPLDDIWKVDNWDLVRPDGLRNPAAEALAATAVINQRLQKAGTAPLPVSTVIAVGPYVGRVVQPSSDLNRGIRVLHPTTSGMLAATRELATANRPCSLEQARQILTAIRGAAVDLNTAELADEGFPDAVSPDIASASTMLLPRVTTPRPAFSPPQAPVAPRTDVPRPSGAPPRITMAPHPARKSRSLSYVGAGIAAAAMLAVIAIAARSCGSAITGGPASGVTSGAAPAPPTTSAKTTVDGVVFTQEASEDGTNCAQHAFGDVQVWLTQHPCAGLHRGLYRAEGQSITASLAVVDFADEAAAKDFATMLTTPGAGSVSDLIRDGKPLPDGPLSFDGAAFTTMQQGSTVHIAQAAFVGKPSQPDNENLRAVASRAVQLPTPH